MMDYSLLLGVHDCQVAEQEYVERMNRPERMIQYHAPPVRNLLIYGFFVSRS